MRPVRVKAGYVTADASVSTTRSTLFCVYADGGVSSGSSMTRYWEFRNGSVSGDVLFTVQRHANGGIYPIGEIEIPAGGIVFPDGIYVKLSWTPGSSSSGMTMFYQ